MANRSQFQQEKKPLHCADVVLRRISLFAMVRTTAVDFKQQKKPLYKGSLGFGFGLAYI
jgi:hypothetical protein